jgi:HSP20 family protein
MRVGGSRGAKTYLEGFVMRTLQPFRQLWDEVDRLSNAWPVFGPLTRNGAAPWRRPFPALNVWETEGELWAEAELPGMNESDVDVSVTGSELTVKGERSAQSEQKEATFHRQERVSGKFVRSIHLPVEIDVDKIEASLKDGVLKIRLPKAEAVKPRKINVKTD